MKHRLGAVAMVVAMTWANGTGVANAGETPWAPYSAASSVQRLPTQSVATRSTIVIRPKVRTKWWPWVQRQSVTVSRGRQVVASGVPRVRVGPGRYLVRSVVTYRPLIEQRRPMSFTTAACHVAERQPMGFPWGLETIEGHDGEPTLLTGTAVVGYGGTCTVVDGARTWRRNTNWVRTEVLTFPLGAWEGDYLELQIGDDVLVPKAQLPPVYTVTRSYGTMRKLISIRTIVVTRAAPR